MIDAGLNVYAENGAVGIQDVLFLNGAVIIKENET